VGTCTDFEEELTMLQMIGQKLGAVIDRTSKCHCEIAGKGIKYSWGLAKNQNRKILLENKRGREKFIQSVRECISRTLITLISRARKILQAGMLLHPRVSFS
jgi:hypothetical protein